MTLQSYIILVLLVSVVQCLKCCVNGYAACLNYGNLSPVDAYDFPLLLFRGIDKVLFHIFRPFDSLEIFFGQFWHNVHRLMMVNVMCL